MLGFLLLFCFKFSFFFCFRLYEESPRWHLGKGNMEKCQQILNKIARLNGHHDLGNFNLKVLKSVPRNLAAPHIVIYVLLGIGPENVFWFICRITLLSFKDVCFCGRVAKYYSISIYPVGIQGNCQGNCGRRILHVFQMTPAYDVMC